MKAELLRLRGRVRIIQHSSVGNTIVLDEDNAIIPAGRDYLTGLLLADGINRAYTPGLTQIGLWASGAERYRADLTDRYTTSGSNAVAVLYVPTTQPSGQPYTFDEIRLYASTGGSVFVAQKTGLSVDKNNTLALTVEWTLTLS